MTTYVLVAGAWHGSWCWSDVVPLLEGAGHRVLTPDLLGMDGGTPPTERPLAAWADQIADILRAEPAPVVLVGHSRAGLVISEVAERVPEKVGLLIYLCAFLLRDGQTLAEVAQQADNAATFAEAISPCDDGTLRVKEAGIRPLFYNRTPDHLSQLARDRMTAEPAAAFTTPIRVTDRRFGSVARAYIECSDDRAIPLATQRSMQALLPCAVSRQLDSDHSPFLSMPAKLVDAIEGCVLHHGAMHSHA